MLAYGLALAVFALDRLTKAAIRAHVSVWDSYTVIPGFFNIIHTENPGAAFSLFSDAHAMWRSVVLIGLSTAALVLIGTLLWHPAARLGDSRLLRTGLALILGGALGNVYDRVLAGAVTDFLEFYVDGYHWPAFNAADSAITIGAALVVLDMARSHRRSEQKT